MAISQTMQDAFNEHINHEFFASYLYLSMSAYCESINLPGFAHWMRIQSQEEYSHAMKLYDFLLDRDGKVALLPIAQPALEFGSVHDVMQQTLDHERSVTGLINDLYGKAVSEGDYASQVHLQWFITEQIEEEKIASELVEQLNLIGDRGDALLFMDRELAARTLAPDPAGTGAT